ncbi:MAG: FHA domain-containing protein, partial [Mycobacterium sp.]
MSRPAPPALTVRYDGSARTFAAGNDVVIGRDLRADVRVAHPLISRAHLVLRFDQGRWIAIDNGSLNGMFVNGRRVPTVDIHDGQAINIGNPDGPQLTFDVGSQQPAGRPPTSAIPIANRPSGSWPSQPPPPTSRPQQYPSAPQQGYPSTQQPRYPGGPYPNYTGSQPQPARVPTAVSQHAAQPGLSQPSLESVTALGPTAAPR